MNENSPTPKCPRCGANVASDAPDGLCPRCLVALNFSAQTELPGEEVGDHGTKLVKPPPPRAPAPEEIAKLFPQLEILALLGQGGMGAVYKARQPKLDRFVALKVLLRRRDDGTADPAFRERFAREARALARLNHPAIVAVYEYGEAGGYPFLLMEYVEGLTLRQLLQRGKLAPEEALAIVPEICEALQFAHQRGIVHRDIKPENVLLDAQGQVKIADFGIAKILVPGAQDLSLTGGKDIVGTPHYMAPEQVEQPARVDHRADIFSLGVVFYEMLTGELPLGKFQPPSKQVQVDVRLDEVVLHALEKEPQRRYQQASQVKTDVEAIAATPSPGGGGRAPASGQAAVTSAQHPDRFWRRFAVAAALGFLALILIPVGFWLLGIALPAIQKARERARAVAALNAVELRQAELRAASGQDDAATSSPASGQAAFGPVSERVLNASGGRSGLHGLDFEAGKVLTAPAAVSSNSVQWQKWITEQGIDLLASPKGGGKWQLGGLQTLFAPVSDGWWVSTTLTELRRTLGEAKMEEQEGLRFLSIRSDGGKPLTFAFQTSGGCIGLLQITDFGENPRAVKLRYKLAPSASRRSEQPAPQSEVGKEATPQ